VYDRGGIPGEREVEKKEKLWRDLDVGTRREKTEIGRKERKEGAGMCYEEREATEHMWNGRSEMRERKRKELEEIQNEDGREIRRMKEIWKRRKRIEKEKGGGC
jgi:hypothetical protein